MAIIGRVGRTVLEPEKYRATANNYPSHKTTTKPFSQLFEEATGKRMRRKERRVQVDFFYHMVSRRSRVCNVSKVTDGRHLFPWRRRCEAYQTFGKKNFWRYRHPKGWGDSICNVYHQNCSKRVSEKVYLSVAIQGAASLIHRFEFSHVDSLWWRIWALCGINKLCWFFFFLITIHLQFL